jgi:hypothetical protein
MAKKTQPKRPQGKPLDFLDGEQWAPQRLQVIRSAAWIAAGHYGRLFLDYLLGEYITTAGLKNGKLVAQYRALTAYGIPGGCVANAIRSAEEARLVLCHRGGMRVATRYTLTWLPTVAETAGGDLVYVRPSDDWRQFKPAKQKTARPQNRHLRTGKIRNLHRGTEAALHRGTEADGENLHRRTEADGKKYVENLHRGTEALSRYSLPGKEVGVGAGSAASAVLAGEGVVPFPGSAQGGRLG